MDKQYIDIAKDFSTEVRRQYPELTISAMRFVGISEEEKVNVSALPYNLEDAKYIIVICEYEYIFHKSYSSDFFVLFIDDKGKASNRLMVDGWYFFFDEPVTGGRISPARHCYMEKGNVRLNVNCTDCDISENINDLWKLFTEVRACKDEEDLRNSIAPYTIGCVIYLYKLKKENDIKK